MGGTIERAPRWRAALAGGLGQSMRSLPALAVHAGGLAVVALVLLSAGQPIFGDDIWWHLGLGEAYAAHGPWLVADPFLFTAQGPPAPASWLADLGLYGVEHAIGFQGLRALHALWAGAILALGWSMARRASGSALFASCAATLFAVLSAYRLFQLRPHLASMFAALVLVRLLILDGELPSRRRIAATTTLFALWANAHAGFVLGLALLVAAIAGLAPSLLVSGDGRGRLLRRLWRLALALAFGFAATLANPSGFEAHGLGLVAGDATPALSRVADEWTSLSLLRLPLRNLPPTPLTWVVMWGLGAATLGLGALSLRHAAWAKAPAKATAKAPAKATGQTEAPRLDPALLAIAVLSLLAALAAVRFFWLGIFPLLLIGQALRRRAPRAGGSRRAALRRGTAALGVVLLVPAFLSYGAWPMISNGIARAWYPRAYAATKYYAHAVWFLRDAGLEGRLYNDYSSGAFSSYWLPPRLQLFVNGSLNLPPEALQAAQAIEASRGLAPGEEASDLLDEYGVDVFFGKGIPVRAPPGRVVLSTTTHLEREPGWLLVFRNLRSAVYLRRNERNRANLGRIGDYYTRARVPFDPQAGFDALEVMRRAPRWAVGHGLLPEDFEWLEAMARSIEPGRRRAAQERLASVYALAGLYERALAIDRRRLDERDPDAILPLRRMLWCRLQEGRVDRALELAERLVAAAAPSDRLSEQLVAAARRAASVSQSEFRGLVVRLPLFSRLQARRALQGFAEPEPREPPGE